MRDEMLRIRWGGAWLTTLARRGGCLASDPGQNGGGAWPMSLAKVEGCLANEPCANGGGRLAYVPGGDRQKCGGAWPMT